MKNKITLLISVLIMSLTTLMAQTPGTINYQGVARDSLGNPIANQQIRLRFKIRNNTVSGAVKYSEIRKVTTASNGLFNVQIGDTGALSQTGNLLTVAWENGKKYLQVEMDATGGANFTNMGTQQLTSVPYAFHAKQAESLASNKFLPYSQLDTTYGKPGYFMGFNGSSWGPVSLLPYNTSDPNLVSFAITNTSAFGGQAIYGMNTTDHTNATGVRGECNKANGRGVYGKAIGASAFGVYGENTTGVAIKGKSTGATGIGVVGESGTGSGVLGNATGTGGVGVSGTSTSWYGVKGTTNALNANSAGVYGEALGASGNGVLGVSNYVSGVAVQGTSTTGTALKGVSSSGYALDLFGKVKIAGGVSSPGVGKVLTSDASGNATWQNPTEPPKVAFKAAGATASIASGQTAGINWLNELYDLDNSFNINTKIFTVPIAGIYHFNASFYFHLPSIVYSLDLPSVIIVLNRNGNISYLSDETGVIRNTASSSQAHVTASIDEQLQVGDQIYVMVFQKNGGSITATEAGGTDYANHYFSGHLVFAN